jgi:hypothetical protein
MLVQPAFQPTPAGIRHSKEFQRNQYKGICFLQTRKSRKTLA